MPSELSKRIRALRAFALEEGADEVIITVDKNHMKLFMRVGDRKVKRGMAASPSCKRADRNNRAWIRRTIREFRA